MTRAAAIFAVAQGLAAGYAGNVVGTVTDASTRRPLAKAAVVLAGANPNNRLTAKTDARGRFLINNVPVDYPYTTYSVVASAAGFNSQALQTVRVLPGAVMAVECSFALRPLGGATLFGLANIAASFTYSHERRLRPAGKAQAGKIFATREGLVGRTTANGHVIRASDRFVALPSRRALNRRGGREFLVRVRYGSHSVVAPVWDVGPWNIRDDYWNASSERENWRTLPRGMPQAQAAYLKGHNGGRDGFGRKVLNPAGIDLSDAVFLRDLRMRDNGWVSVEYLWDPTLVSTRDPEPTPAPRGGGARKSPRTLQEIIALAESILVQIGR